MKKGGGRLVGKMGLSAMSSVGLAAGRYSAQPGLHSFPRRPRHF